MNVIAIDIGNTNIKIGLYLDGNEEPIVTIKGENKSEIIKILSDYWQRIPVAKRSKEGKRDGVFIICSTKAEWSEMVQEIILNETGEKGLEIGFNKDIPVPIKLGVPYPANVGVDRAVAAAAAYFVVEDAVIVADFGTATTIDVVDEDGNFLGGLIAPGLEAMAQSLKDSTSGLPRAEVKKPVMAIGQSTEEAINCGLFYSAAGLLEFASRKFSEELGKWPQTIVTGESAEELKGLCDFVDNWVPSLVVKGIVLAYQKYIQEKPTT